MSSGYSRRIETTSGRLRTRITILAPQRTDDGLGGFTTTYGGTGFQWLAWAEKHFASGGDTVELEQTQSRRQYSYRIRRRKDVTVTSAMRVLEGTQTLTITAVIADDEDRSAQVLHCTELAPT